MLRRSHRAFLALSAASGFIACGLSIEGIAPLPVEGTDAGRADTSAPSEAGPTPVDAGSPAPDCHVAFACDDGGRCLVESCAADGGRFTEFSTVGNTVGRDAGVCTAASVLDGQRSALSATIAPLPMRYRYRFDTDLAANRIGVLFLYGGNAPGSALMYLSSSGLSICRTSLDGGQDCPSFDAGLPEAGTYLRLSGEVDRADGGTSTLRLELADSPTSCAQIFDLVIGGNKQDQITVAFGCNDQACATAWEKARFEVEPLP